MTKTELVRINRAITVLQSLIEKPHEGGRTLHASPIEHFVREYLAPDPGSDFGCLELWQFFHEVVAAGELEPLPKSTFLRQLPAVMEAVYNLKKSHHIERLGHRVRGFRGVNSRSVIGQPPVRELEAPPG